MTRSLCLCRKISKGWVSVQGPDVLMITMEGQYYSGWGEGPPRLQCLEQGSLHLTSRHKGRTTTAPCLPEQLENHPSNKGCYPRICPGMGLEMGGVCATDLTRASRWRKKPKAIHSPNIFTYLKLFLRPSKCSWQVGPFLITADLLIPCFDKGHSCSENETGATVEGFRGGLLGGKRKSCSATHELGVTGQVTSWASFLIPHRQENPCTLFSTGLWENQIR